MQDFQYLKVYWKIYSNKNTKTYKDRQNIYINRRESSSEHSRGYNTPLAFQTDLRLYAEIWRQIIGFSYQ